MNFNPEWIPGKTLEKSRKLKSIYTMVLEADQSYLKRFILESLYSKETYINTRLNSMKQSMAGFKR